MKLLFLILGILILAVCTLLAVFIHHGNKVMKKKASDARICYEDLLKQTGTAQNACIEFYLNNKRPWQMLKACFLHNPFPKVRIVLCFLRVKAVVRLFHKETVVQTGPAAAVLAYNAAACDEIKSIRAQYKADHTDDNSNSVCAMPSQVTCDVAFAGLQVVRLYMMAYEGNEQFKEVRCDSGMRVNNALNGSFYKYETSDQRFFSAHVYYESQKEKLMKALQITKAPEDFTMSSLKEDKKLVADKMKSHTGLELEELAFSCGGCGCMLRDRNEWEKSSVGSAVCDMPLYRLEKVSDTPVKVYGPSSDKGPLSGIKVLDLTHIIAGPACTRVLAEQGADVLLVRRGAFTVQEQAMLELDGWAGKHSIQLDFNKETELARMKELVKEADVIVSSYQYGVFDKFGLSREEIHQLNPNVIYASMVCFSDTEWMTRPGWAPLAEDITGLSIRNGSLDKPKNLNGVPLDYIPGFILAAGVLKAIRLSMTEGGAYDVTASLTRTAYWLHECSDLCADAAKAESSKTSITATGSYPCWNQVWTKVDQTAVGNVRFPSAATYQDGQCNTTQNMRFTDGNTDWKSK